MDCYCAKFAHSIYNDFTFSDFFFFCYIHFDDIVLDKFFLSKSRRLSCKPKKTCFFCMASKIREKNEKKMKKKCFFEFCRTPTPPVFKTRPKAVSFEINKIGILKLTTYIELDEISTKFQRIDST